MCDSPNVVAREEVGRKEKAMRMYEFSDYGTLYVGTTREICSLYKNLRTKTNARPRFTGEVTLCDDRMYGIHVDEDGQYKVLDADTCLTVLVEEG